MGRLVRSTPPPPRPGPVHHSRPLGGKGLEPPAQSPEKTACAPKGGAESGAVDAPNGSTDPDLRTVVSAWATLPEHVRQAILLLVRSAGPGVQP